MATGTATRFYGQHALVIGGSLTGLMTARVLSEHFERVSLVERDALPDAAGPRKGVPQSRQLHGLLKKGELMLESWFPGITQSLLDGGAVRFDFSRDTAWHHFGVWKTRFESGIDCISATRPVIEAAVRRRVRALGNVRVLDEYDVEAFVTDEAKRRVTGIRACRRHPGSVSETISADFVVDASGRGSQSHKWLAELGRAPVEESLVKVRVSYASRTFKAPPAGSFPWKALYVVGQAPDNRRIGAIFPVEGNRWMAVLGGLLDETAPTDHEGWMNFSAGLPVPDLHRAVSAAEPDSDIAGYKFPAHQRRHYERMRDFPEGLAILGDAACSFNPIYGQGITTGSLGAAALGACLREQATRQPGRTEGLSARIQKAVAKTSDNPWMMSTGEDFRYTAVEGNRPFGNTFMQWYTGKVHKAAESDSEVALRFLRAMHLMAPPTTLMTPGMIMRVLGHRSSPSVAPGVTAAPLQG